MYFAQLGLQNKVAIVTRSSAWVYRLNDSSWIAGSTFTIDGGALVV